MTDMTVNLILSHKHTFHVKVAFAETWQSPYIHINVSIPVNLITTLGKIIKPDTFADRRHGN